MRQLKGKGLPDNWRHLCRAEFCIDVSKWSVVDLIGQCPDECSKLYWQSIELTKHIQ